MRKDFNALAVVRPKPDQVQTKRAVDLHQNILNNEFEVGRPLTQVINGYLVNQVLKKQTNCGRVVLKEKRVNRRGDFGLKVPCEYIFEGDDLFCEWLHRKDKRDI